MWNILIIIISVIPVKKFSILAQVPYQIRKLIFFISSFKRICGWLSLYLYSAEYGLNTSQIQDYEPCPKWTLSHHGITQNFLLQQNLRTCRPLPRLQSLQHSLLLHQQGRVLSVTCSRKCECCGESGQESWS